ncbi:hypothetical protein CW357_14750 [Rummeliibacillus sp. TYF005]|uniref:hypothetical protein n=1 Tax=Rummeliibacillus sp. TYF005 TaxID=2058214 RepID=UPI000F532B27|nr:hypothetical protein [Rummeliibacillus sp. TYF005]RPJ94579.1 hypothetical protein CW357_14750 [Rummeliibacillus sp. TYF005]
MAVSTTFDPHACSSGTKGVLSGSSQSGYIAATVTSTPGNCAFQYRVYLDMWEQTQGEWVEMGYRSGVASQYGTNHDFRVSSECAKGSPKYMYQITEHLL